MVVCESSEFGRNVLGSLVALRRRISRRISPEHHDVECAPSAKLSTSVERWGNTWLAVPFSTSDHCFLGHAELSVDTLRIDDFSRGLYDKLFQNQKVKPIF